MTEAGIEPKSHKIVVEADICENREEVIKNVSLKEVTSPKLRFLDQKTPEESRKNEEFEANEKKSVKPLVYSFDENIIRRKEENGVKEGDIKQQLCENSLRLKTVNEANFKSRSLELKTQTIRQHYYPEGNWGWIIVFTSTAVHFITSGLQLSFGVILSNLKQEKFAGSDMEGEVDFLIRSSLKKFKVIIIVEDFSARGIEFI
ncbi:monocarboxylate transporter 10-like protein [Dinothrombium tinctorium]|uniref:Monocarboxylate transporter 10-like protein n=1 Tax=Dinothrombium tinctorium TaxID=1965070 RepID=A0A3S3RVE7_9ACAR|nr:monocarboxylate transporter 10-like protein [Dinothrombium tinctorium]